MEIEVLYILDCPTYEEAFVDVRRIVAELAIAAEVKGVRVADPEDAARKRFLGSPTVRVDGRDVEPGADARTDFVYGCRVYRTEKGHAGKPAESWLREALAR